MFGMTFQMFFSLAILGLIASFCLHFLMRYRMLGSFDAFLSKWIAGWIGGWIGSPVFGHWGPHMGQLYLIPALLGAFSGPFLMTAMFKEWTARFVASQNGSETSQAAPPPRLEMRKAS